MKQFTLTFVLCIGTIVYGQNQLLSSVDQFFDSSTNTFENNGANDYSYDSNGNLTENIYYTWDSGNGQWIISDREIYTYNSQNKVTIALYENYDQSTGLYSPENRTLYTYNGSGNLTEILDQNYTANNQLENSARFSITYNANLVATDFYEEWNGSSWIPEDRSTYNYDSNQRLSSTEYESYNNGSFELTDREVFTYNTNGEMIEYSYEPWNGSTFSVDEIGQYIYDTNGNITDQIISFSNIPTPDFREKIIFDTSASINALDHPFKDKTGLDNLIFPFAYVNKPLRQEYQNYNASNMSYEQVTNLITYDYANSVLSNHEAVLPEVTYTVYPNPTRGDISIFTSTEVTEPNLSISDVLGKKLKSKKGFTIDITDLPAGVYLLSIKDDQGNSTVKKIIKN